MVSPPDSGRPPAFPPDCDRPPAFPLDSDRTPAHPRVWNLVDSASRLWWRTTGRVVNLDGAESWLAAPTATRGEVRHAWLGAEATRVGGTTSAAQTDSGIGLMPDMSVLDGPDFDVDLVHSDVRDFYEHTSMWRMDVWTRWTPIFVVPGAAIEALFGRRVQQLALPVNSLDVAHGVDSVITRVLAADGRHVGSAWLRKLRKTGIYMYSGYYRTARLPGRDHTSVHVSFPLENGNVQVFLRPRNEPDGSFTLTSPPGAFGDDGAYVTVTRRGRTHATRVPIHETFRVYVDADGVLRTDHVLKMFGLNAVRLHYRLTPVRERV